MEHPDARIIGAVLSIQQLNLFTQGSCGTPLLENASLTLQPRQTYGLVGDNGVGKSTLLRTLSSTSIKGVGHDLRIAFVADMEATSDSTDELSPVEYLLNKHAERVLTLQRLSASLRESSVETDVWESINAKLRNLDEPTAMSRANVLARTLDIQPDSFGHLSEGWKHRLALAAAVFVDPDVLLLDEPTRSLDARGISWLVQCLATSRFTTMVASHDANFLNKVCDHIVHFSEAKLSFYPGNYTAFASAFDQKEVFRHRALKAQESRRKRWEATIEALKGRANGQGQIRSRRIALATRLGAALDGSRWKLSEMGPRPLLEARLLPDPVHFDLRSGADDLAENDILMELTNVGVKILERRVLSSICLTITPCTRICLVGSNGSGKSTLLNLLARTIMPSEGKITRWEDLRIGYLPQHAANLLQSTDPVIEWLRNKHPGLNLQEAIESLSGIGLSNERFLQCPVAGLSAGQRTRLLLASIQLEEPHLLLLDEPTGHLDADSTDALVDAISFFGGAVVFASHDLNFIEKISPEIFCVRNGSLSLTADPPAEAIRETCTPPADVKVRIARARPEAKLTGSIPAVHCRRCRGDHFTHACPRNVPAESLVSEALPRAAPLEKLKQEPGWKLVGSKPTSKRTRRA